MYVSNWTPDEWQDFTDCLCRLRHGSENFQRVPDEHGGDFGIESFSFDGLAYQAYCPEGPLTAPALYNAQRDKITRDLDKFGVKNTKQLARLFGPNKISRWVLLSPDFTSAVLLQHASDKSKWIRSLGLGYVSEGFQVVIQSEKDFPQECKLLADRNSLSLPASANPLPATQKIEWVSGHSELIDNLVRKLASMTTSKISASDKFVEDFISKSLIKSNLLDDLRTNHPVLYESLRLAISHRESFLELESRTVCGNAKSLLIAQLEKLKADVTRSIPGLADSDVESLIWGTVADWLLQCPLHFEGVA